MIKKNLRKQYLDQRIALSRAEIEAKSQSISNLFLEQVFSPGFHYIHCFLPILKHHEINTWLIINALKGLPSPPEIVVSKSDLKKATMTHFLLQETLDLKENKWGILEPDQGVEIADDKLDLVLVPMLIFDENGHRVGYGKGFYDRFLQKCRPDCLKAGLCLEAPVPKIEDVNPADIKMDLVISPGQIYRFPLTS